MLVKDISYYQLKQTTNTDTDKPPEDVEKVTYLGRFSNTQQERKKKLTLLFFIVGRGGGILGGGGGGHIRVLVCIVTFGLSSVCFLFWYLLLKPSV